MKFLRNIVDSVKPHFEKGGRFDKLYPAVEAFETFLFVPGETTSHGVHVRDAMDMKRTMITVVIALIPTLLFGMWNVGYQHYLAYGMIEDTAAGKKDEKPAPKKAEPRSKKPAAPDETA